MKKRIVLALLILTGVLLFKSQPVRAEEEGLDVVLVIDASYSMAFHDPDKSVYDAIRTVAEMSLGSSDRIGYVLYNDSIVKDRELTGVTTQQEIEGWMQEVNGVTSVKGTDVGLGLKTAQRMLKAGNTKKDHGMILLISDGDTESDTANPNRTQEAVNADVESVLKSSEAPIYFIQFSQLEYRNKEPMNQWSARTGGQSHSVQSREELLTVVTQCVNSEKERLPDTTTKATGELEEEQFTLSIPVQHSDDQQVKELVVTMTSESLIKEVIYEETTDMTIQQNDNQVIVTITNPKKESYLLKYQTENNQPVSTSTYTKMADLPKTNTAASPSSKTLIRILLWGVGLLIAGSVIGLVLGLFKRKTVPLLPTKEAEDRDYFTDSLEGCFVETPNGQDIPIQNWPASLFQSHSPITMYELLTGMDIDADLSSAKRISFRIGKQNTLQMKLKSGVKGLQQAQNVPAGTWVTLSVNQGAYLILKENELELDIHIRKKSHRGGIVLG